MNVEQGSRRRGTGVVAFVGALLMVLPTLSWSSPAEAQRPEPPPEPSSGLGSDGPCDAPTDAELEEHELGGPTSKRVNAWNSFNGLPDRHVWVYEPTGSGMTRDGGSCDDDERPVVVIAHGYPALEFLGSGPTQPNMYGSLIQNLVSNGYIVVYPNYDANPAIMHGAWATVWIGFVQAVKGIDDGSGGLDDQPPMTTRADLGHIGLFGHSFGGGMLPRLATSAAAETTADGQPWGHDALWVAAYAPSDLMLHCDIDDDDGDGQAFDGLPEYEGGPIEDDEDDIGWFPSEPPDAAAYERQCPAGERPVNMPPNARVLLVSYEGEENGWGVWTASAFLYRDMTTPVASKWGIVVGHDVSHPGMEHLSGHLTPVDPVPEIPGWLTLPRQRDHLKWYGTQRNLHVLDDCAVSGGSVCDIDQLLGMGTWSDGVPATGAQVYVP